MSSEKTSEVFQMVAAIWDSTHPMGVERTIDFELGPRNPQHGKKGKPERVKLGPTLLAQSVDGCELLPFAGDFQDLPKPGDGLKIEQIDGRGFFVRSERIVEEISTPKIEVQRKKIEVSLEKVWVKNKGDDEGQFFKNIKKEIDLEKITHINLDENGENNPFEAGSCLIVPSFSKLVEIIKKSFNDNPDSRVLLTTTQGIETAMPETDVLRAISMAAEIWQKKYHYGPEVFQVVVDRSERIKTQMLSGLTQALMSKPLAGPLRSADYLPGRKLSLALLFSNQTPNMVLESFSLLQPKNLLGILHQTKNPFTWVSPDLSAQTSDFQSVYLDSIFSAVPLFLLEAFGLAGPGKAGSQVMVGQLNKRHPPHLNPHWEGEGRELTAFSAFCKSLADAPEYSICGGFLSRDLVDALVICWQGDRPGDKS